MQFWPPKTQILTKNRVSPARHPTLRFSTRKGSASIKKIKKNRKFLRNFFFSKNKNFFVIFFQHRLARRATFDSSGSLDSLSPLSHFFIATITSKISFVSPDFFACSSLASPFNSTKRGPSKFLKKNDFRYSCLPRSFRSHTSQNSGPTRLLPPLHGTRTPFDCHRAAKIFLRPHPPFKKISRDLNLTTSSLSTRRFISSMSPTASSHQIFHATPPWLNVSITRFL